MAGDLPVKKTGSADNERLQINRALEAIFNTLARADSWDAAASFGDHAQADYATALSELDQFAEFGIPSTPTLSQTVETTVSGTEIHTITANWSRGGDDDVVYDLEIRESATNEIDVANTTLYGIPIVSNDSADSIISFKGFFDVDRKYWFRVRFRKNTLVSNWSQYNTIITAPDAAVPNPPQNLTASAISDGVTLVWEYDYNANFNTAEIEILRGTTVNNRVVIDRVSRPALTYIDEPIATQQQYNYAVRARSYKGLQSTASNAATATPLRSTITIYADDAPGQRPDGSALRDGDRWIDTTAGNGNRPYTRVGTSWVQEYTRYDSNNYSQDTTGFNIDQTTGDAEFNNLQAKGTVQSSTYTQGSAGWSINSDGSAEFNDITARGSIFAGSGNDERVEITVDDPDDYRIWIGAGAKNDTNGVFWVKSDGSVKIDKNTFEIGAQPNKGVASGSLTTGITNTANGVEAEFASFTSNGQAVLFEIVFSYFAFNNESNPSSCSVLGPSTGILTLHRKIGAGSYSTISSAGFSIPNTAFLFTDPSVPDECQVATQGEATRSLIDASPPAVGDLVQYRVVIDSWNCPLLGTYSLTGTVNTNAINAAFTQ